MKVRGRLSFRTPGEPVFAGHPQAGPTLPAMPQHPVGSAPAADCSVSVHLLPGHVAPAALVGATVVVIDALRASVTISAALEAGALVVRPVLTVEEAIALADRTREASGARPLVGGERRGVRVAGFDLGNSPAEYTPGVVTGRVLIFTTTNGTRALLHAARASTILVGSLPNRRAVCEAALGAGRPIHILCAGTDGSVSLEDALSAGALVERMTQDGAMIGADDTARVCLDAWCAAAAGGQAGVLDAFRRSAGGRNLLELGMDADVALCARPDWLAAAPAFDPVSGELGR